MEFMETNTQTNTNEEGEKREMTIEEIAKRNFVLWKEALLTGDARVVGELYAKDNTFHPTMSGDFKKGIEAAIGYFEHFLLINPDGEVIEEAVQPMGDKHYSHNGMYNFEVDENGKRVIKECRFTYNWRKEDDGKWKIIHHHSSVKPQA